MTDRSDEFKRGITCEITAFEILNPPPPPDPRFATVKWMAVATAHVYDPDLIVPPLTRETTVLAGETMRVISSRSHAQTQAAIALNGLLYQLAAIGLSASDEAVEI